MEGRKRAEEANQCSDAELMRRMANGDPQPLAVLYERYGRMVHSVLARSARGTPAAELDDLCQETFLTVFETAARYEETGKLKSWLCGIAVRKARSRLRRGWLRRNLLDRFAGAGAGVAAVRESGIESQVGAREEVERALSALPEPQRQVLLLHVVDNLSGDEIAAALGISPKTVWTRLHRARQAMRRSVVRDTGEGQGR